MWAAEGWPRGSLLPQGHCPCGDAPPIVVVAKSAQLRFPRRHKLRIPRSGHANQNSLTSLLRLSPPRGARRGPQCENCARSLAPQGHFRAHSVGLGAPPLPTARGAAGAPLRDIKKKMRRARWKRKMFGGSVCAGADLLPPAGEGWLSLAAVRDGNAPPLGKPPARGSQGYPQRLSPLPLTLLRRTASGSEKRSNSMRQPPRRRSTIRHGTAAANSQKT